MAYQETRLAKIREAKAALEEETKQAPSVLNNGGRYKVIKENLKVKEVWYDADRYIVCHNPIQAEHDRKAREEMVEKLGKQIKQNGVKSLISNSGYRRYLLLDKDAVVGINQNILKEEARYDGGYVLRTNSQLDTDRQPWPIKTSGVQKGLFGK